ncbi:TetR/AcrR family transcriptional regulator [Devosia riboflavina]
MIKPTDDPTKPKKMGRPRNAEVDRRILVTAIDLFIRAGWADFSIDEVARRAKVGKASIYLRWRDKGDLLFDALSAAYQPWDIHPTNSFRDDLERLVVAILSELSTYAGWAINRAQSEPGLPPRLYVLCQNLINARLEGVTTLIEAAKARGEVAADVPNDLIMETVTGAALGHSGLALLAKQPSQSADRTGYASTLVNFLYPVLTGRHSESA